MRESTKEGRLVRRAWRGEKRRKEREGERKRRLVRMRKKEKEEKRGERVIVR